MSACGWAPWVMVASCPLWWSAPVLLWVSLPCLSLAVGDQRSFASCTETLQVKVLNYLPFPLQHWRQEQVWSLLSDCSSWDMRSSKPAVVELAHSCSLECKFSVPAGCLQKELLARAVFLTADTNRAELPCHCCWTVFEVAIVG